MPGSAAIRLLFACFHLNSEHGIHAPQPLGIDLSSSRARARARRRSERGLGGPGPVGLEQGGNRRGIGSKFRHFTGMTTEGTQ